jgi:hypothetical protein
MRNARFQTHDKRKTIHGKRKTLKAFQQTHVARYTHARYTKNGRTKNAIFDNRNVHPTVREILCLNIVLKYIQSERDKLREVICLFKQ